jgi:pantoate ligase / CMP/dCMP kinase
MTQLFTEIDRVRDFLHGQHGIGLIPTMGALHQGHLSLIQRSRCQDRTVVVSIFINPLQFSPGEDYHLYPRQLERDLEFCQGLEVDAVFAPNAQEIFGLTQSTLVHPPAAMTEGLCGRSRSGHFVGVATVVTKLLNIVQPNRAYFGQKDAQQLAIIQNLVKDLNFSVEVISCPTARDNQGLALSSRNQYLTEAQKKIAPQIYASLQAAQVAFKNGEKNSDRLCQIVINHLADLPELALDYVQVVDQHTLASIECIQDSAQDFALLAIAVYLGKTRLIDNILLN